MGREFPYEDACGCFEFLDGFELLRYLKASEFGAVSWEIVPGTDCRKAVLGEVDESTPAYREFERQLYRKALERLGLWAAVPPAQTRQTQSLCNSSSTNCTAHFCALADGKPTHIKCFRPVLR